jgi:hypothetical protein
MSVAKLIKQTERILPTANYETITPSQAQEWLDRPARNRKMVERRVGLYAAAMLRGDWVLTSQGIAFDELGSLIDGQHRLHAIIRADIPVDMLVIRAASNRSQLVLDQGAKRTPHDQIALREGWQVLPIHTAVAKVMIESVGGAGANERRSTTTDIQLLDRFYVRHHKAIEFAVETMWASHGSLKGVIIAPTIAPVARAYYTIDNTLLARFCDVLATGMSDGQGESPIIVLRNWLIAGRERSLSSRAGKDRNTIYKKAELALKAFIDGDSIQRLSSMTLDRELFPIPGDIKPKIESIAPKKKSKN